MCVSVNANKDRQVNCAVFFAIRCGLLCVAGWVSEVSPVCLPRSFVRTETVDVGVEVLFKFFASSFVDLCTM